MTPRFFVSLTWAVLAPFGCRFFKRWLGMMLMMVALLVFTVTLFVYL